MWKYRQELSQLRAKEKKFEVSGTKKWGLVIAWFAIRSPVPRSALFLK
jgi:hypothetical protein